MNLDHELKSVFAKLNVLPRPSYLVDVHAYSSLELIPERRKSLLLLILKNMRKANNKVSRTRLAIRWLTIRMKHEWGVILINHVVFFETVFMFLLKTFEMKEECLQQLFHKMNILPFVSLPDVITSAQHDTETLLDYINYTLWLIDFQQKSTYGSEYIMCNASLWEKFVCAYIKHCVTEKSVISNILVLTLADYKPASSEYKVLHRMLQTF